VDNFQGLTAVATGSVSSLVAAADIAFNAIRENKFWIFTHPFNGYYKGLTDALLNGENPSYSDVEFD
jgi:hypothetical protein